MLTLSGDLHHYARYATEDGAKAKITAGLAGYLHPRVAGRHLLAFRRRLGTVCAAGIVPVRGPIAEAARGRPEGPFRNPGFAAIAVLDLLLIWMVQFALREPGQTVAQAFPRPGSPSWYPP